MSLGITLLAFRAIPSLFQVFQDRETVSEMAVAVSARSRRHSISWHSTTTISNISATVIIIIIIIIVIILVTCSVANYNG